jgi:UDP-N-acetylmuramoylalanine-D-glutamate ligase
LAAYVVSKILKIKLKVFNKVIKNFIGLPHRSELIYKSKYSQIINNSKATNLDSTIKSINNYKNIYLILGGRAKERNFFEILKHKSKIKKIYLIGEAAYIINRQLRNEISCDICQTLDIATKKIYLETKKLKKKYTILLAPACSSFDQFSNFEDRGKKFKRKIELLFND